MRPARIASTVDTQPVAIPTVEGVHPLFSNDAPAVAAVPVESLLGLLMVVVYGVMLF